MKGLAWSWDDLKTSDVIYIFGAGGRADKRGHRGPKKEFLSAQKFSCGIFVAEQKSSEKLGE